MHLVYLYYLYCLVGPDSISSFTKRLYPIVDSDMTTLKKSAYRAKTETFEIKLKRLSLNVRALADVLNCMSISARFTFMALSSFDDTIFFAFSITTFRAGNHGNTSCNGNKVDGSLP
jgi:hypothetical protein